MNRELHRAVQRWLSAERTDEAPAESGLRRVFEALPAPRLPAGFTERVMLGAGLAGPVRAAVPLAWRIAVGGALLLAGAALATAPPVVAGLVSRISAGDLLRLAAGAVVETCERLAEGLAVWQTASSIGDTLAQALLTPYTLAAMVLAMLLSAGGLRMLHGLLAGDRRPENARA